MTKRNNGALAIGIVIVIVAALVAIFTQSRTFAQAMGQDYAPEKVDSIHVYLQAMGHDAPSREVVLSGEDPPPRNCWPCWAARPMTWGMRWGPSKAMQSPWTTPSPSS